MKTLHSSRVFVTEGREYTQKQINEAFDAANDINEFKQQFDSVSDEIIIEYHRKALMESLDTDMFTFENGIAITGANHKVPSRYNLRGVLESSKDSEDFCEQMENLTQRFFGFSPSEIDKVNLATLYEMTTA